ncbi:probable membrane-associated kinase regulator 1 [Raphanus sativus]|uniref:Probable membrane-associated kinase regulator 1 n=1 Tax=Raphanus sativus TaxID=3726 RepID=A0A6J0L5X3_RAPSA|nr:probable membrane-associated kinase regulator 1 [Raphanus sativus]
MRRQPRQRHSPPQSHSSPSSSSSSSEFEFNISISPRKAFSSLCPADELFYKGQLLPLQISPRLSLVRTLCSSSTSSSSSSSSTARDSTESSSSTDSSTSSFPLLHAPPLDCCDSSRTSSFTDEEDIFSKETKKSGFSLSRLSSVFKKDPKTVSSASPPPPSSSVKRMSSTAKEVIRKYMKKVKPLYDKLSQKQSTTATALKTESSHKDLKTESSFSGNLMKYTKRGRCAASCPSSMRSSPSHSGVLTRGGFPSCGSSSSSNSVSSSMEELQSAIQGAIAHCKNSMLQKSLVSSHEI